MLKRSKMNTNEKKGFTLVELSLSIAFVAVLSLAVALIITNSISAYHRGLVLNQVNTIGMELVDDMRAAVQNSPVVSLNSQCSVMFSGSAVGECEIRNGQDLVAVRHFADVNLGDKTVENVPVQGAFCTGAYSYIWNSGYFYSAEEGVKVEDGEEKMTFAYKNADGKPASSLGNDIRLLKVKDEKRAVCAAFDGENNSVNITGDGFDVVTEEPIELLSNNNSLALYDLYAPSPAVNAGINNAYYSVSFVLGTIQGGANVRAQGSYCVTPEGSENSAIENFDYCSINKFNFAAQAIGGGE